MRQVYLLSRHDVAIETPMMMIIRNVHYHLQNSLTFKIKLLLLYTTRETIQKSRIYFENGFLLYYYA